MMEKRFTQTKILRLSGLYDLYVEDLNIQISSILLNSKVTKDRRVKLISYLNGYVDYITQNYNLGITTIEVLLNKEALKYVGNGVENPLVKLYINNIIKTNNQLQANVKEIRRLRNKVVPFKLYKQIISKFNDKISTLITKSNYLFYPLKAFGAIGIVRGNQKGKQIDWGKSNKAKEAIIERGGIPYYKADAEQAEKEGKEYKGEKWIVYRPDLNFFFHWFSPKKVAAFPIINDYKFIPARASSYNSPVKKLSKIKEDLAKANVLYTRTVN